MKKLLLATNNPGKVAEMKALLECTGIELVTPRDLGLMLDVPETGETYAENAAMKARAFAQASNLPSLGDDSGLEVNLLGGRPGIHSHRFASKPNASDADRRQYLLELLDGKPHPWKAHFHATVVVALPSGETQSVEGRCDGEIIPEERGSNGFGYDPIFLLPELGHTMAELTMDEKNLYSHRARAVKKAIPILEALFRKTGS